MLLSLEFSERSTKFHSLMCSLIASYAPRQHGVVDPRSGNGEASWVFVGESRASVASDVTTFVATATSEVNSLIDLQAELYRFRSRR